MRTSPGSAGWEDRRGGRANGSFAIARYNPNGSLDSTFGSGGKVATTFSKMSGMAAGLALQPDGKIVVAGWAGGDRRIVRYNAGGSLDTTFGPNRNGIVITDLGKGDQCSSIAIQPDGKIVVAGGGSGPAIVRYHPNGKSRYGLRAGGIVRFSQPAYFFDVKLGDGAGERGADDDGRRRRVR